MKALVVSTVLAWSFCAHAAPGPLPLKVGVTLHPYFSWTKNVVGDLPIEVRSILPGDVDAGNYQPRPEDIAKLKDLDAIVVNGLGHDDFIDAMLKAAGNAKIALVRPNEGTPQIRSLRGDAVNSHTFISFTNAIQQSYAIAKALGALRPEWNTKLQDNAAAYAKKLRAIKAKASNDLVNAKVQRVVTVHDGYGYLLQEFGVDIAGVVEPAHGLVPSAKELGDMVALMKQESVQVVFAEESFPPPLLKVLQDASTKQGKVRVYVLSHVASGDYTADKFEREMQANATTMVQALVTEGQ